MREIDDFVAHASVPLGAGTLGALWAGGLGAAIGLAIALVVVIASRTTSP
jgi:hypothetical protein